MRLKLAALVGLVALGLSVFAGSATAGGPPLRTYKSPSSLCPTTPLRPHRFPPPTKAAPSLVSPATTVPREFDR